MGNTSISKMIEAVINKVLLSCPYCGNIHTKHSGGEYTTNCGVCGGLISIKERTITFFEATDGE